jgi:hypothetical protein
MSRDSARNAPPWRSVDSTRSRPRRVSWRIEQPCQEQHPNDEGYDPCQQAHDVRRCSGVIHSRERIDNPNWDNERHDQGECGHYTARITIHTQQTDSQRQQTERNNCRGDRPLRPSKRSKNSVAREPNAHGCHEIGRTTANEIQTPHISPTSMLCETTLVRADLALHAKLTRGFGTGHRERRRDLSIPVNKLRAN